MARPLRPTTSPSPYLAAGKFAPDLRNSARLATLLNEVVAVDDHTVQFMLKKPPTFASTLPS